MYRDNGSVMGVCPVVSVVSTLSMCRENGSVPCCICGGFSVYRENGNVHIVQLWVCLLDWVSEVSSSLYLVFLLSGSLLSSSPPFLHQNQWSLEATLALCPEFVNVAQGPFHNSQGFI